MDYLPNRALPNPYEKAAHKIQEVYQKGDTILYPAFKLANFIGNGSHLSALFNPGCTAYEFIPSKKFKLYSVDGYNSG